MKTGLIWLALPVLPVMTWLGLNAQGKATPPSPIAYVSAQRIAKETAEGKSGLASIQEQQRGHTAAVRAKQDAIAGTRRQLAAATTPEARARLEALIQQQGVELQGMALKAQADLQEFQRQVNTAMLRKVQAVVADIVKDRQIQVVLNSEAAVIWASPTLDLTNEVIARMNATAAAPPKK